jgi:hypothetical protein
VFCIYPQMLSAQAHLQEHRRGRLRVRIRAGLLQGQAVQRFSGLILCPYSCINALLLM